MKNIKRLIMTFVAAATFTTGALAQGTLSVTMNTAKTTASFQMPNIGVTVNYSILRNISKKTEFSGIPTEPVVVKKVEGDKYQPYTPLTYQLNDLLLEGTAQNITQAEGIAIHLEKAGDDDTWSEVANFLSTDNYVPGTYRLVAAGTGLYKDTLTSATFTVIDEAQLGPISYKITIAEGTDDSENWEITPDTDLYGGETITITYKGKKRLKGLKAEAK